jgi:RHS repeat-associated protein
MMTRALALAVALGAMCVCASGQNIVFTQGTVGSGLENTIQVPLRTYPGRGSASMSVNLTYSSRVWRIAPITTILNNQWSKYQTITEAIYAENSTAGWKSTIDLPIVEWPRNDDTYYYTGKPFCHVCGSNFRQFRVARVYITLPDGSKHELRKGDQPYEGSIDMFGTFYAVDGSRLRYDSTGQSTGTLYFPDGTRYVLAGGTAQFIDRNGNTLNYNATNRQWTDTVGRVINMPLPANPAVGEQLYSLPGMPLPYKFIWKHLSDPGVLTPLAGGGTPTRKPIANEYLPFPGSPPTPPSGNNFPVTIQTNYSEIPSLFISDYMDEEDMGPQTIVVGRGQVTSALFDPIVLTEIVLPNNLSYKFTYNIYGEIDKVVYPTGAFEKYTYSKVPAPGDVKPPYTQASRGVTLRQASANGTGNDLLDWTYQPNGTCVTVTPPANGAVTVTCRKWYGTPEHQGTFGTITKYWPFGFEDSRQGHVYEERIYAPGVGGAMLRRTVRELDQTTNTVQPSIPQLDNTTKTAYRNPRPTKEVNLILDTGGDALVKTMTYEYASNGYELSTGLDRTASNETHFASIDQASGQAGLITVMPAGSLASRLETIYLNDSAYRNRNILSLPTSVIMKDAAFQVVSKSELFYDEVGYPLLTYGDLTGADYIDPGTNARGNATTSKAYIDIGLGTYLENHAQFDQCGNLRNSWNARGALSQTDYSSTYKHAFATQTTTAVPDPSGLHGSTVAFTTTGTFDLATGLMLTTTDLNGQTTTMSYQDDFGVADPMTRLRKITRPNGSWTKYSFGETLGNLFSLVETQQDASRTIKMYQYVDPLGRPSRKFASEGGINYLASDTIYDQLGRVWKTSNPYRTTTLDGVADVAHTNNWTITQYEALGRVDLITSPDGATLQTLYQGIYTTITDQAGRQRRQKTDALGRTVRVDEANLSGSLGTVDAPTQPTYYDYNTQGNLVHITQGSSPVQHRYFKYDALGRLTYERQVEQAGTFTASDALTGNSAWSRKLVYDETIGGVTYQGLLTSANDARNIQTQFRYDNLNRIYQVSYSDTTPTITNNYDQPRTGYFNKGKLTEALTAAVGSVPATAQLYNFDLMGNIANHQQTVGSQSYTLSYGYNLGGGLTSQTYPSGRVVNYAYDDGARLSQVSSGATNYASQFDYTSSTGLLQAFTMGNGAVESYAYNSRLQLQSLDLTRSGTQIQRYEYKYGVYNPVSNTVDESKNSGQIAQIEGFIGTQKQWQQRFAYDSLNRLASAREFRGDNSQQSYLVNYEYDLFGNRYQKQAQNGGNPFTQKWVEAGDVDQSTNRFNSGVTYDNAGNITVDSRFRNLQFQYDANNRQKQSANLDGSGAVVSVFDAVGQRVGTQVSGALTNVLVYDATAKLVAEYSVTPGAGGTQYVFSDQQGSPRAITSAAGVVVARHDYVAFGEELGNVGMRTSGQGYGGVDGVRQDFAGMENNETTGMAHTLWREYDSYSARWTAPDPYQGSMELATPQSFNRYVYVNNDPVNHIDPTGLSLADIGVLQTNDAREANLAERQAYLDALKAVNEQNKRKQESPPHTKDDDQEHKNGDQGKQPPGHETPPSDESKPRIADMVTPNNGVGKDRNGNYRFAVGPDGTVGHDGDHVLGASTGSTVSAINGLTGVVLTRFDQGYGDFTTFILIDGTDLVMVLKDLHDPGDQIRKAPVTTPAKPNFMNKNGTPQSKVTVKAGDFIGRTNTWTDPVTQTGMHFGFVRREFIQEYRINISEQKRSPSYFFVAPCGAQSPVSCR